MLDFVGSSIRNKLLMVTGFGASLVLVASFLGIYNSWSSEQMMSSSMHQAIRIESEVAAINKAFSGQVQEWKNVLIRGHVDEQREKYWSKFLKRHQSVQGNIDKLLQELPDGEIKAKLLDFKQLHGQLLPLYKKGRDAFVSTGFDHKAGDAQVKGIDRGPGNMLLGISLLLAEKVNNTVEMAEQQVIDSIKFTIFSLLFGVVFALVLFLVMIKKIIVQPAATVARDLSLLAGGDFTNDIRVQSSDEIGQVAASAILLKKDIGMIVNKINKSVFRLSTSAEEMAHITDQSNKSASQQRIETEQVASAMSEMKTTVNEVAGNAQLASESANQANGEVNTGQSVVNDSINAISKLVQQVETAADVIHELESNSVEIGSILDVIRSIAEQTNLLALNAAIEAARAGEQGRGFAVVADEVRVLAQRTQTATEEIQSMIEKVQNGAQQAVEAMNQSRSQADVTRDTAAKAGEILSSITSSVTNINEMNTLIANLAKQQNLVAEEINSSISSISQSAEVASEGAEHTAQTSEDLRNVAEELKHVISRLKV